jgi:hypothetical protein
VGLEDFLSQEQILDTKYDLYIKLKKQLEKDGLPPNIATYKASTVLTPERLEKIKLIANNEEGLRPSIEFVFNSEEELLLIAKYFNYNPSTSQVKDGSLLIELLKLLDTNGKKS